MVRLNAQLINMSAQKHNPVRDWELDLRGYRIPVIENLGATLDQFDTIDFTDNDIRKLDQFPLLKRLKHILLSNNRIVRIAEDLQENLPSLETLILINNSLKELSDIDPLSTVTTLKYLSFLGNPVFTKKNYRLYVIHKIPSLRVLDFRKVRLRERETASKLFKKKKTQQPPQTPVENGAKAKTFTPGDKLTPSRHVPSGPSKTDVAAIRKAIANAKTLEEIEHLNQMLKTGQIPNQDSTPKKPPPGREAAKAREEEVEEEEEEEEEEEMPEQGHQPQTDDMDEDSNQASGYQDAEGKIDDDEEEEEEDDDETEEEDMEDN